MLGVNRDMIEKILDKYYTNKIKEMIKRNMMFWVNLDIRFIENKNHFELQIKDNKYNDNEYRKILTFDKKESIINICLWRELEETIKKLVERYYKEIK